MTAPISSPMPQPEADLPIRSSGDPVLSGQLYPSNRQMTSLNHDYPTDGNTMEIEKTNMTTNPRVCGVESVDVGMDIAMLGNDKNTNARNCNEENSERYNNTDRYISLGIDAYLTRKEKGVQEGNGRASSEGPLGHPDKAAGPEALSEGSRNSKENLNSFSAENARQLVVEEAVALFQDFAKSRIPIIAERAGISPLELVNNCQRELRKSIADMDHANCLPKSYESAIDWRRAWMHRLLALHPFNSREQDARKHKWSILKSILGELLQKKKRLVAWPEEVPLSCPEVDMGRLKQREARILCLCKVDIEDWTPGIVFISILIDISAEKQIAQIAASTDQSIPLICTSSRRVLIDSKCKIITDGGGDGECVIIPERIYMEEDDGELEDEDHDGKGPNTDSGQNDDSEFDVEETLVQ
ncbi:hypothetical protein M422DRAFT_50366 [Sphaerobolus stellatus SS14]|uniref:Uncharacterized protein n=1 Tax=Sphaerobolus stellatus (strain SS14) TaxID=990650 RepID=A0A0C9URV5_SPHS4|nr:hypothetical protein M422DRAFT_50366 [Sphaerobolus stellatus SS14]